MFTRKEKINVFLLAIAFIILGLTESACGGDSACDNGSCGPDPTEDGGTSDDTNPIGTSDGGDVASIDGGDKPDAGKMDCSKLRAELPTRCRLEKLGCTSSSDLVWSLVGVEEKNRTCLTTYSGPCRPPPMEGTAFPLRYSEGSDFYEDL